MTQNHNTVRIKVTDVYHPFITYEEQECIDGFLVVALLLLLLYDVGIYRT